jgi:outer membrane lipopolysaccharide assembly protein LptE/RlpB
MRGRKPAAKAKTPANRFPALKTALDQIHIEVDRSLFLNNRDDIASKEEAIAVREEISVRLSRAIEWIKRTEELMCGITTLK